MTIIIGLTGSFGSGCSYLAKNFIVDRGYKYLSLSTILKQSFEEEHPSRDVPGRHELQEYGNLKRQEEGSSFLSERANEIITKDGHDNWVVDSIRNPEEVVYLKSKYPEFYLLAVFADHGTRWKRVEEIYDGNIKLFNEDDERDQSEEYEYGQRVRECCDKADIIISNDNNTEHIRSEDYSNLKIRVEKYLDLVEKKIQFVPNEEETLMAMAYANSFRSRCLKRKVGAVIIDSDGNLFSSGLNNTPVSVQPCLVKYGECKRDQLRADYTSYIGSHVEDQENRDKILEKFKEFKILDYCRALHAEETAILNAVKTGSSNGLIGSTLYTTTYPCNLCANKIVKVGITKIVYAEPYPMIAAKEILKNEGVVEKSFEGVSFNGYFRVGGK